MTYEKLFLAFSGRIDRGYFWMGTTMLILVELNFLIIMGFILDLQPIDFWNETRAAQLVVLAGFLLVMVPSLALGIKRLHDRGLSGWWYGSFYLLLFQVYLQPFYGRILQLGSPEWFILNLPIFLAGVLAVWLYFEMGVMRGERKKNRYGNEPSAGVRTLVNG